jgi:hypothetical protein
MCYELMYSKQSAAKAARKSEPDEVRQTVPVQAKSEEPRR